MTRSSRLPSAGTVLGFIALMVALGGTAFAATGGLVHITDSRNAAFKAQVASNGALRTFSSTAPHPAAPARPFELNRFLYNHYPDYYVNFMAATTATLAVTRITVANNVHSADDWQVEISWRRILSGQTCLNSTGAERRIAAYQVPADGTAIDNMATPLVLKPAAAGESWCLQVYAYTRSDQASANQSPLFLHLSGFVVSGTPPTFAPETAGPEGELDERPGPSTP